MLDIKFVRTNPDAVKENIKKKFQDEKIPMVDEVIEFDAKYRAAKTRCDELRAQRNKKSKEIGGLMAKGQKEEAEKIKAEVKAMADEMTKLEEDEKTFAEEVKNRITFHLVCATGQLQLLHKLNGICKIAHFHFEQLVECGDFFPHRF